MLHPIIVSSLTLPVPRDWNDEQLLRQQLLRVTSCAVVLELWCRRRLLMGVNDKKVDDLIGAVVLSYPARVLPFVNSFQHGVQFGFLHTPLVQRLVRSQRLSFLLEQRI